MIIKGAAFSDGTETCPGFPLGGIGLLSPGTKEKELLCFIFLGNRKRIEPEPEKRDRLLNKKR